MTDNVRFKINTYLQMLKYIDSADMRNETLERLFQLIEFLPDEGYDKIETELSIFLAEETEQEDTKVNRAELYAKYKEYCKKIERVALTANRFRKSLEDKGYIFCKVNGYDYVKGLSFKEAKK